MKVLFLIDTLEAGGAEHSLRDILGRFRRVRPVMCHIYRGRTLRPLYEAAGIQVVSLDIDGQYAFRRATKAVMRVVEKERPDILHSTLFRSDIVGRMVTRRCDLPLVCSLVNDSYSAVRYKALPPLGRLKLSMLRRLDSWTSTRVRRFVAISLAVKASNAVALSIPVEKIDVICRGRDPKAFAPALHAERTRIRGLLVGRDDVPVVLSVARLLQRKGQEDLLRSFALVRAGIPEAFLVLAGEGPQRERLETLSARLGVEENVRFLGTRSDIPELLQSADVFAFPSHYEGQGGALVEAMFAALPIVASDIPVHRESVEHDVSAHLVPPRDPRRLAEGILRLLENPEEARRMGRSARMAAMGKFHIDDIAPQYEDLYERVLGEAR